MAVYWQISTFAFFFLPLDNCMSFGVILEWLSETHFCSEYNFLQSLKQFCREDSEPP